MIENINDSEIVKEQKENPEQNVLTGLEFSDEELTDVISRYREQASSTYDSVLHDLGAVD